MFLRTENNSIRVELNSDVVLIGSHPKARIRANHPDLHRRHAVVTAAENGWYIHDLNSRYGVLFKEERVRRRRLEDGDKFVVGPLTLVVEGGAPAESDDHGESEAWLDDVFDQVLAPEESKAELSFFLNKKHHRTIPLERDALAGTSVRSTIKLPNRGISSIHCLFTFQNGVWRLIDLFSDRGVVKDGKREPVVALQHGDEFHLGDIRVLFRLRKKKQTDSGAHFVGSTDETQGNQFATDGGSSSITPSGIFSDANFGNGFPDASSPLLDDKIAQAQHAAAEDDFRTALRLCHDVCDEAPYVLRYRKVLRSVQQQAVGNEFPNVGVASHVKLFRLEMKARKAFVNEQDELALKICEQGLDVDPWHKSLLVLEGLVFEKRQLLSHCAWLLATAREPRPEDASLNRPLAKIMQHLGALDRAERYWELVAEAEPENSEVERQIRKLLVQKTLQKHRNTTPTRSLEFFEDDS